MKAAIPRIGTNCYSSDGCNHDLYWFISFKGFQFLFWPRKEIYEGEKTSTFSNRSITQSLKWQPPSITLCYWLYTWHAASAILSIAVFFLCIFLFFMILFSYTLLLGNISERPFSFSFIHILSLSSTLTYYKKYTHELRPWNVRVQFTFSAITTTPPFMTNAT